MGDIVVTTERSYQASPEGAYAALADYGGVRARTLPPQITDWRVTDGGSGAGTRVAYALHATEKRVRQVDATVTDPTGGAHELLEQDGNSTLAVRWTVAPGAGTGSKVAVRISWAGAGGVGGFFERRFAPAGIRKIFDDELARLGTALDG